MTFFSRSEISRVRRSGPAITRSMASSSSGMVMACFARRAARRAPSLITLAKSAAQAGATVAPDRVDLVDEHDGGSRLLRLLEQVPDPGRPHPDEHLHEIRAADGQERDARLAGHGPGQQRLAGTGRTVEQEPL